jgi:hypothetical protein
VTPGLFVHRITRPLLKLIKYGNRRLPASLGWLLMAPGVIASGRPGRCFPLSDQRKLHKSFIELSPNCWYRCRQLIGLNLR